MPPCCTLYEHVPKPIFTIGITDIAIEQPRRHSNVSTQATQLLKTSTGEVRNAMSKPRATAPQYPVNGTLGIRNQDSGTAGLAKLT
jgi:hypothetical protein